MGLSVSKFALYRAPRPTYSYYGLLNENNLRALDRIFWYIKSNPKLGCLLSAIRKHDPATYLHSLNVLLISMLIYQEMYSSAEYGPNFTLELGLGSLFHDLGKMFIPGSVLNKPGKLTEEELNLVQQHAQIGWAVIKRCRIPQAAAELVLRHHCYAHDLDTSYTDTLDPELISRIKIIGLADAFDAMTSSRPYSVPKNLSEAYAEIVRCLGGQFDVVCGASLLCIIKRLIKNSHATFSVCF